MCGPVGATLTFEPLQPFANGLMVRHWITIPAVACSKPLGSSIVNLAFHSTTVNQINTTKCTKIYKKWFKLLNERHLTTVSILAKLPFCFAFLVLLYTFIL